MLAERKLPDTSTLAYPLYASPKLDGVRALIVKGRLLGRSLKPIPNKFVAARFSSSRYEGLDGELVLGDPAAKDVYRVTQSALARHEGEPDVKFYAFDIWSSKLPYETRLSDLRSTCTDWYADHIRVLPSFHIKEEMELLHYEQEELAKGYEGLILRSPGGLYKFGRSTMREGGMLKLKRFTDGEAEVWGLDEEMHNANEAKTNELGRTERSSHQANLVGKGTMGKLALRDLETGKFFGCGVITGDRSERDRWWKLRGRKRVQLPTGVNDALEEYYEVKGRPVVKYKHFAHGAKDRPRHPVYLGRREPWDR